MAAKSWKWGPSIVVFAASLVFGAVLLSNKGGVNLKHVHNVTMSESYKIYEEGVYFKDYSVYFSKGIDTVNTYQAVYNVLNSAKRGDTVTIFLAGDGGFVETLHTLVYAIKNSKAHVTTVVSGDVYSAHAFLALSGHEIVVNNPNAILMFHRSSLFSHDKYEICSKYKDKKDRKQSLEGKCVKWFTMAEQQDARIMAFYKNFFTESEFQQILDGHDVFIFASEIKNRLEGKQGTTNPVNFLWK